MSEETIITQTEYRYVGSGMQRKAFWISVFGWAQQIAHAGKVPDDAINMDIDEIKEWVDDNHGRIPGNWGMMHSDGRWKEIQAAEGS